MRDKAMLKSFTLSTIAAIALVAGVSAASAQNASRVPYAPVLGATTAPIGWAQFCQTPEGKSDCDVVALPAKIMELNERRWRELLAVNTRVNREVEAITDIDLWGVAEKWSYPANGKGDCEDYVLEKRRQLIKAGWPRQSLLITVVRDKKGDGHAVLIVKTDRGDFILDNVELKVLLWSETDLRMVKRQSEQHPNNWVSIGNVERTATTTPRQ
jgi:predicted transglutaminase-like cysteine proteinase